MSASDVSAMAHPVSHPAPCILVLDLTSPSPLCDKELTTWTGATALPASMRNPELFFPIGNTGPAIQQIEDAKAVCRRCEVVDTCLKWAIESGQDAGVWGGLSEDERRALKRRNARARRAG